MLKKLIQEPEQLVLILAALLSVIVSILDMFGLLDSFPLLSGRIPALVLLLVGITLGYLITERRGKLERIESLIQTSSDDTKQIVNSGINQIINAVQGAEVQLFSNRDSLTENLIAKIRNAKHTIDVTHFTPSIPKSSVAVNKGYYDALSSAVKERKIRIRRILTIDNQEKLDWAREMISEYSDYPFFIGCYSKIPKGMPIFSMIIIDGNDVYLTGGERGPSYDVDTLWIKHPLVAKVIQGHFDTLWRNSMRLNEKGSKTEQLIDELNRELRKK